MWFLFAPGAGAASTSPWMANWTERLSRFGTVVPFDYPYRTAGRKLPDPKHVLVAHHEAVADAAFERLGPEGILIGKSMGSRIGLCVGARVPARACVCFGYPLLAQSGRTVRRDELLGYSGPTLLIQGARDPLCPLPLLEEVLAERSGRTDLFVVEEADHSLEMTKTALRRRGLDQEKVWDAVAERLSTFLASIVT